MPQPIHLAQPTDIDALIPLIGQFYTYFQYPYEPAHHRQMVEEFLANPRLGSLWLVRHEGVNVGYLALTNGYSFEFGGHYALVDEFFIGEGYRSLGLGRTVLAAIQAKASQLGLKALHLQTEAYNPRAKQLYESLGFQDLNRSILSWRVKESQSGV
jgi:GNAT superfamily N-acetyltransferase